MRTICIASARVKPAAMWASSISCDWSAPAAGGVGAAPPWRAAAIPAACRTMSPMHSGHAIAGGTPCWQPGTAGPSGDSLTGLPVEVRADEVRDAVLKIGADRERPVGGQRDAHETGHLVVAG